MAVIPKISRRCPYAAQIVAAMDGDMCHICHREVHDLTGMDEAQSTDFLRGCADETDRTEVCIRYRLPPAAAAFAAVAMLGTPLATLAEDATPPPQAPPTTAEAEDSPEIVGVISLPQRENPIRTITIPDTLFRPNFPKWKKDVPPARPVTPAAPEPAAANAPKEPPPKP